MLLKNRFRCDLERARVLNSVKARSRTRRNAVEDAEAKLEAEARMMHEVDFDPSVQDACNEINKRYAAIRAIADPETWKRIEPLLRDLDDAYSVLDAAKCATLVQLLADFGFDSGRLAGA